MTQSARHILAPALLAFGLAAFAAPALADEPPFGSTADTVFDIIRDDDPSAYVCLNDEGRAVRQMWDKRVDGESDLNTFLFAAHFSDAPPIDIILNPEFGDAAEARAEALRYAYRLGQLPRLLRGGIRQLGVHKGKEGFHAGTGKIFMYQDQSSLRISQKKLEESLFHEAVHASLDAEHRLSPGWTAAQARDGAFLTRYAARRPEREDLAETMLFAFALLNHPGRIPPVDSDVIARTVTARIAYIAELLQTHVPAVQPPDVPDTCR